MGIREDGIEAEQWMLEELKNKGFECFQPDAISFEDGYYFIYEVKHQERFTPPPFEGHGLPRWQVKRRMDFFYRTGIRTKFVVREKASEIIFWQFLDVLEEGEIHDTHGSKPRRVYKLDSFLIWK